MDKDGFISNGELFQVLKMMVGNNLKGMFLFVQNLRYCGLGSSVAVCRAIKDKRKTTKRYATSTDCRQDDNLR